MVVSASLMVVVCLVVLVKQFWLLGLVMIALGLSQILFICALGTVFESSCTLFLEKTCQIDWYLMSPSCRKNWVLIMRLAQTPNLNTMGGLHLSNLNSFLMVRRVLGR